MQRSCKHPNWTKEGSLWVRSKEILRNQRGYLNPYILGASAPAGFDKTSLISWWGLNEESGVRNDAHGTNHLTDNNTVLFAAGKVGNAADFEADSSEYLDIVSNASLQTGDIDFTGGIWVKFESLPGYKIIASKWDNNTAANQEYQIFYDSVSQKLKFTVRDTGGAFGEVLANDFGVVTTGVWYFVLGWHDAINNLLGISVNDVATTAAHTTGLQTSNTPFAIGTYGTGPVYHLDGLGDEAFFAKRVYSATERTWLYNSGAGRQYSDL